MKWKRQRFYYVWTRNYYCIIFKYLKYTIPWWEGWINLNKGKEMFFFKFNNIYIFMNYTWQRTLYIYYVYSVWIRNIASARKCTFLESFFLLQTLLGLQKCQKTYNFVFFFLPVVNNISIMELSTISDRSV